MTRKGSRYRQKVAGRAAGEAPAEGAEPRSFAPYGVVVVESWSDGDWAVRRVTGSAATRTYRCPGCDHDIRPGTPHVVVWPDGDLDDRRHWHAPCWTARARRRVKVHRSKNAPRYG